MVAEQLSRRRCRESSGRESSGSRKAESKSGSTIDLDLPPTGPQNAPSVLSVLHMASEEELKAEIERLRAENDSLKKPARGKMSLKVSEKGALSVYGLGRFPVTLYREQWEKLLAMADEIRSFILENDVALKKKE